MAYPSTIDNFNDPQATDKLNSPSHSTLHRDVNTAIEALETKVGVDGSGDTNSLSYKVESLDYEVTNPSSSNPGHGHTLASGATDVTATFTEVNRLVGVTDNVQTQIDSMWWRELVRVTLGTAGLSLSTGTIPTRTFLRVIITIPNAAGATTRIQFNATGSSQYSSRRKLNDSSDNTTTSADRFEILPNTESAGFVSMEIWNPLNSVKMIIADTISNVGTAGTPGTAADAPFAARYMHKWHNNAQITSIELDRASVNLPVGTSIIVLGHD